jgi:ABC-type lipoprotein export system ATPase subunit
MSANPQQTPRAKRGPAVLSARNIRKSFSLGERKLEILHGVNLDLYEGELLALTGTSGAGKSTLLHILGLLDRPSEGSVTIEGHQGITSARLWVLDQLDSPRGD